MSEKYNLNAQITATHQGMNATKAKKIEKVTNSIDSGLPATIYTAMAGTGQMANHYVNAYEYQIWTGLDADGSRLANMVFKVRLNWGKEQSYDCYMDADLLKEPCTGVIYYTVAGAHHLIRPSDFAKDFVNSNGQGQYFFYEKTASITTAEGLKIGTSRLRCSYIENEYLVLSAYRADAGLAYLEMDFDIGVKAINFDVSLWSGIERLGDDAYAKLYYKDADGNWLEAMELNLLTLSTSKAYPDNFYLTFPENTNGIRFEVYDANPSGDRNRGRVVLGDMIVFFSEFRSA